MEDRSYKTSQSEKLLEKQIATVSKSSVVPIRREPLLLKTQKSVIPKSTTVVSVCQEPTVKQTSTVPTTTTVEPVCKKRTEKQTSIVQTLNTEVPVCKKTIQKQISTVSKSSSLVLAYPHTTQEKFEETLSNVNENLLSTFVSHKENVKVLLSGNLKEAEALQKTKCEQNTQSVSFFQQVGSISKIITEPSQKHDGQSQTKKTMPLGCGATSPCDRPATNVSDITTTSCINNSTQSYQQSHKQNDKQAPHEIAEAKPSTSLCTNRKNIFDVLEMDIGSLSETENPPEEIEANNSRAQSKCQDGGEKSNLNKGKRISPKSLVTNVNANVTTRNVDIIKQEIKTECVVENDKEEYIDHRNKNLSKASIWDEIDKFATNKLKRSKLCFQ